MVLKEFIRATDAHSQPNLKTGGSLVEFRWEWGMH